MDKKREIKTIIVLLVGILILGFTHYSAEIIVQFYNPKNHLSLHILMELIAVAVAVIVYGWETICPSLWSKVLGLHH